jgi:hypothetical protein
VQLKTEFYKLRLKYGMGDNSRFLRYDDNLPVVCKYSFKKQPLIRSLLISGQISDALK